MISGSIWLLSCSKRNHDDDCGPFPNKFKSTGVFVYTLKVDSFDSLSRSYIFDTLKVTDTVQFNELAIQLTPEKSFYIGSAIRQKCASSVFNEAYACSPPIPYSDEQNDYIIITSTKDFDQTHKIGKNLTDLFDVVILDLFKNIIYYRMSLQDYLALRPNTKDELILILKKAPEKTDDFLFNIQYSRTLVSEQKLFVVESTKVVIINN